MIGDEASQSSLGLRVPKPSAAVRNPFQGDIPSDTEMLRRQYGAFRASGPTFTTITFETQHVLTQKLFDTVEDINEDFTGEIIDLYVFTTRMKIRRDITIRSDVGAAGTIVVGSAFYACLPAELEKLHPKDRHFTRVKGKPTYKGWRVPEGLDKCVQGPDTPNVVPWSNARHIIAICCVGGNHWITVRICLREWKVELYDSMSH